MNASLVITPTLDPMASPHPRSRPVLEQLLERADQHFAAGRLEVARDFLELAVEQAPARADLLATLGAVQCQLGSLETALDLFSQAVSLAPESSAFHTQRAAVLMRLGRKHEFEAALRNAIDCDPTHRPAVQMLADHLRENRAFLPASRLYLTLLRQNPNDVTTLLALGKCLYELDDRSTAGDVFREALRIDPANEIALEAMDLLGSRQTQPCHGDQLSPQTPSREPDQRPPATVNLPSVLQAADEAFARGDLRTARQLIGQALEAAPDQLPLLLTLGSLEFQLGESDRAFALFSRATDRHPENATAHVQLAACALKIGRLDRFEAALNQALELEPAHLGALRMLANFQLDHRHYDSAARVYFMILKRDPDDREALLSIAVCFQETGDDATARMVLEQLLSLDPSHALARRALALLPPSATNAHAESNLSSTPRR